MVAYLAVCWAVCLAVSRDETMADKMDAKLVD